MSAVAPRLAEPPLILALDIGTSSCRASLYDARGRRLTEQAIQRTYAPRTTPEGGAELDAGELTELVTGAIDALGDQAGGTVGAVGAVALSCFWHSLLGLDERGRPVTPILLWMDARSRAEAAALKQELDERAVHARTGCVLHWSYWPAKLRWLRRQDPARCRTVRRWVSFGEYLAEQLLGEAAVSVSMASGTGLLNQHTADWDAELLGALPLERERLSPLTDTATPGQAVLRPVYAARWPWLRGVPWLPAVGDGACSNLGAGCATRERLALMIGTSGALRALWRADDLTIPWGAWCYRADRRRFVVGGAINDGGSLLNWLRGTLQLPPVESAEAELAALEPDGHGLTVLPLWAGERSPGWAADARGAVVGLRLHTRPIEILRAALEAIALYCGRLAAIVGAAVPEGRKVIATGGALLRSPTWLQIMADVLGRPVLASAEPEASSRGAALLALEALGLLPEGIEALPPDIARVYEPIPSHTERYQEAAARQQRLYELLVER